MSGGAAEVLFTASFDDGHEDDLAVAERCVAHGARATFYVALNGGRGPEISGASLRRLVALGMEVGSHTASHKTLAGRAYADVLADLRAGKRGVEDLIGAPVAGLSYPEGVFDAGALRAAREAGFSYARTTVAFRTRGTGDPFRLPVTVEFERKSALAHLRHAARDANAFGAARFFFRARGGTDPLRMTAAFLAAAARSGGFVHLRTRSWELVRNGLLDAFGDALSLAAKSPGVRFATNAGLLAGG